MISLLNSTKLPGNNPSCENCAYAKQRTMSEKNNIDPSQLANQFVTTRPFVTSNIIGATTMDQLKLAVTSVEVDLTEEIEKEIDNAFQLHGNKAN